MASSGFKDRYGTDACSRCGAREIIPDAKLEQYGSGGDMMRVLAYGRPDAHVFKKSVRSKIRACVCTACGFIDLYARDPEALRKAYDERDDCL